eukprot:3000888-Rhodomonas_salina.3
MCLKELNIDQQPAWADLLDRKGPGTDPETNPIQIRFATTMTFWSTKGANYGSRQLKMDYLAFCLSTTSPQWEGPEDPRSASFQPGCSRSIHGRSAASSTSQANNSEVFSSWYSDALLPGAAARSFNVPASCSPHTTNHQHTLLRGQHAIARAPQPWRSPARTTTVQAQPNTLTKPPRSPSLTSHSSFL